MSGETPSDKQPPPDDDTGCFENRQRLDMWACSECGHVEFFMPLK
jgi:hypothetical protein